MALEGDCRCHACGREFFGEFVCCTRCGAERPARGWPRIGAVDGPAAEAPVRPAHATPQASPSNGFELRAIAEELFAGLRLKLLIPSELRQGREALLHAQVENHSRVAVRLRAALHVPGLADGGIIGESRLGQSGLFESSPGQTVRSKIPVRPDARQGSLLIERLHVAARARVPGSSRDHEFLRRVLPNTLELCVRGAASQMGVRQVNYNYNVTTRDESVLGAVNFDALASTSDPESRAVFSDAYELPLCEVEDFAGVVFRANGARLPRLWVFEQLEDLAARAPSLRRAFVVLGRCVKLGRDAGDDSDDAAPLLAARAERRGGEPESKTRARNLAISRHAVDVRVAPADRSGTVSRAVIERPEAPASGGPASTNCFVRRPRDLRARELVSGRRVELDSSQPPMELWLGTRADPLKLRLSFVQCDSAPPVKPFVSTTFASWPPTPSAISALRIEPQESGSRDAYWLLCGPLALPAHRADDATALAGHVESAPRFELIPWIDDGVERVFVRIERPKPVDLIPSFNHERITTGMMLELEEGSLVEWRTPGGALRARLRPASASETETPSKPGPEWQK